MGANAGGLVNQYGQTTLLKNGREDELESDELGVLFMINAGYDPKEMIGVMKILKAAAGDNRVPEFQSSHPDPENRIEHIKDIKNNSPNQPVILIKNRELGIRSIDIKSFDPLDVIAVALTPRTRARFNASART